MNEYNICDSCETICPYCNNKEQYSGDPIGYDGDSKEVICDKCNKKFIVVVNIIVEHHCYRKNKENEE